jgi:hypothetical protein
MNFTSYIQLSNNFSQFTINLQLIHNIRAIASGYKYTNMKKITYISDFSTAGYFKILIVHNHLETCYPYRYRLG